MHFAHTSGGTAGQPVTQTACMARHRGTPGGMCSTCWVPYALEIGCSCAATAAGICACISACRPCCPLRCLCCPGLPSWCTSSSFCDPGGGPAACSRRHLQRSARCALGPRPVKGPPGPHARRQRTPGPFQLQTIGAQGTLAGLGRLWSRGNAVGRFVTTKQTRIQLLTAARGDRTTQYP